MLSNLMLMKTILQSLKFSIGKLLSIYFLTFTSLFYTQNEGKIWYFGSNAGLDFNSNPPSVLTNGQINTLEGTASIADENGSLLFYTDGVKVYSQNHTLMPNGAGGLGGNSSSAQSAIVVPHPGNSNQYFIFTVSEYTHSNLFYSIVDLSLNNGLGDVVANSKAISVLNDTGEYIQATPSADGTFWWILTHKNGTADYYAFKLTPNGIDINQPVISVSGTASSSLGDIGFIKFNNPGNRMVRTSYIQHYFEISHFNNATGEVTNSISIPFQGAYGAEFSPNNRFLYISGYSNSGLKQYDLEAGNTTSEIQATAYTYSNLINGAIQAAPDGKIYSSRFGASALDVISEPNFQGADANFQLNYQSLGSNTAQLGLPNIISNLVSQTTPGLDNLNVLNITGTGATLSSNISSDGGSVITERGFYYGTDSTTISNLTHIPGTLGEMNLVLENLQPETVYYFGAFATNQHGTTHLNWGNFTTSTAIDDVPPVALCNQEITIFLDENGYVSISFEQIDNGSYDNDAIAEIFIDKNEFSCENIGINLVTLTVIDATGNISSCQTIVHVEDNIAPVIEIDLETNSFHSTESTPYYLPDFFVEGYAWAIDNCTQIISDRTQDPPAGTLLYPGTHQITLTATDESGNTGVYNFEIIIETILNNPEFNSGIEFNIYPNPTTQYFKISNSKELNIESIELFNLEGKKIQSTSVKDLNDNLLINVEHLKVSTYLVVIKAEGKTVVKKLVKR